MSVNCEIIINSQIYRVGVGLTMDDKTKNSIVEKFETAAKEFNFNFITPYCLGENNEL